MLTAPTTETEDSAVFHKTKSFYTVIRARMTKSASSVQALYELCKKTFSPGGAPPPSSQAVHKLCSLLSNYIFPSHFTFNSLFCLITQANTHMRTGAPQEFNHLE